MFRSNEGLTFETSASKALYRGQFTLSRVLPTDAAPQLLEKLTPFISLVTSLYLGQGSLVLLTSQQLFTT